MCTGMTWESCEAAGSNVADLGWSIWKKSPSDWDAAGLWTTLWSAKHPDHFPSKSTCVQWESTGLLCHLRQHVSQGKKQNEGFSCCGSGSEMVSIAAGLAAGSVFHLLLPPYEALIVLPIPLLQAAEQVKRVTRMQRPLGFWNLSSEHSPRPPLTLQHPVDALHALSCSHTDCVQIRHLAHFSRFNRGIIQPWSWHSPFSSSPLWGPKPLSNHSCPSAQNPSSWYGLCHHVLPILRGEQT